MNGGHLGVRLIDHTDTFHILKNRKLVMQVCNDKEDDAASLYSTAITGDAAKDPPRL